MSIEKETVSEPKILLDIGIGPYYKRAFDDDSVHPGDTYIGFDLPDAMTHEGAKKRLLRNSTDESAEKARSEFATVYTRLSKMTLDEFALTKGIRYREVHGDGTELPFADKSVDEVAMMNVVGDPTIDDLTKNLMLVEAMRVAKPSRLIRVVESRTPHVAVEFFERHVKDIYVDISYDVNDGVITFYLTLKEDELTTS